MSSNRDFKVGDWIEIKFSGRVKYNDIGGSETLTVAPDPDRFPHRVVHGVSGEWATLVEPPVKAGDEVNGKQALKLPIGSVVVFEPGGGASLKVNDTQWVSTSERTTEPFVPIWLHTTLFTVLHIGGPDRRLKA